MTGRTVPEWQGSTPDAAIPVRVKMRIWERDQGRCQLTGLKIDGLKDKYEFDHIIPLAMGGEHRERNLQLVLSTAHREKTKQDVADLAKARRLAAKHAGIERRRSAPLPGGKRSPWKKKISGEVVRRDASE